MVLVLVSKTELEGRGKTELFLEFGVCIKYHCLCDEDEFVVANSMAEDFFV